MQVFFIQEDEAESTWMQPTAAAAARVLNLESSGPWQYQHLWPAIKDN